MYIRTEDLLSIRDGEPMDSADRERLLSEPAARAGIERLRRVRDRLAELPALDPPANGWSRVEAAVDARARRDRRIRLGAAAGAIAAGVAAVIAVLALVDAPAPGIDQTPRAAGVSGDAGSPAAGDSAAYLELVQESARLERVLASLPAPRRVMRLGTAGTIVDLENQIAVIDQQLTYGGVDGLAPEYRQALWRNRVEVMDALVQVRYVQAQRIAY